MRLGQDIRFALRSLHRTPTVAAAVVVTFAIGIGANTAVFSVVDAVLLRPLMFADPDRLVVIQETLPPLGRVAVGATEFEGWRDHAQSFDALALMAVAPVILTGAGEPERLDAARVSASLLPLLGIHPTLGRTFSPDEEVEGRDRVVMMSDAFWRGRFGADPSIIGRNITLNDQTYVVVGILPRHFQFPRLEQIFSMGIAGGRPELWMPFAIREPERGENSFAAIGKLKPGVSADAAASELRAIVERVAAGIPNAARQIGVDVVPLRDQITGGARASLMLLWAAIATVLLIACGNITNLLLVRGGARGPELAVRSALGASRATLIRHSLVDSLILAAIGGAGGLLVALWVLPLILRFAPATLPRLDEVVVNARALAFAAVVTMGTGVLVGLVPARRAAQTDVIESLKQSVRTGSSRRDRSIRNLTIVAQAALTVACLGAAGLIVRSLENVLKVDSGFQSEQILAVDVSLSPGRYASREAQSTFARAVLERLAAVPGAAAVGFVSKPPLSGISVNSVFLVGGTEDARIPFVERPMADVRSASPGYFRALGIPLLEGSLFDERAGTRPVAVISSAMARRAWPGESALGKRFRMSFQPARLVEVVGVVGDVRNMGLEADPTLAVYVPFWQVSLNASSFVARMVGAPATAAATVRAAIADVDRDVPIQAVRTLDTVVLDSVAGRSFQATLLLLFGAIAVILAGVGTFGVVSNAVAERSRELGIRLALGASQASLQRMVVGGAIRLVGAGVVVGLPLAIGAGYALRNSLFGVGPQNPAILASAAVLVLAAGLGAAWLPARRAIGLDPAATLRAE